MSYAGQLNLTAVADRDRCPDVEVFTEGVRRALDELAGPVTSHPDRDEGLNSCPTPLARLTIGPMPRLWPAAR